MQSIYERYLQKHALYSAWIPGDPPDDLALVVVIPAYLETEIWDTLESLLACERISPSVEVLILLNDGEQAETAVREFHRKQYGQLLHWCNEYTGAGLRFIPFYAESLPTKKAGVGLARKIGMDEAVRRFAAAGRSGIIICLDADTLVEPNYLQAIFDHFKNAPRCPAVSINYAHRLEGLEAAERRAIVQYELHLRIFLAAKRWTGFPYAFETIGSAMAVRAEAYCAQGGMNTRQAGEDFYFLNKFTPLGQFAELNETCVYPSARISERVPFGTGRAIQDILKSGEPWRTYPPGAYIPLQFLFSNIEKLHTGMADLQEHVLLKEYLDSVGFAEVLNELRQHTASLSTFRKRFFRWFDAFRLMKYLHYGLEREWKKVPVLEAGRWIWIEYYGKATWPDGQEEELEEWLLSEIRAY